MSKPNPPDQERIELVINGDDPESHKSAQETARILSAPQLARTIQQRIDECRKQIVAVTTALNICGRVFQLGSIQDLDYSYPGVRSSDIARMSNEIQVACSKALTARSGSVYLRGMVYDHDGNHYCQGFSAEGHEVIAKVLNDSLPTLMDQLNKLEGQLEDLFAIVKGK